jgi:hypothetical protein
MKPQTDRKAERASAVKAGAITEGVTTHNEAAVPPQLRSRRPAAALPQGGGTIRVRAIARVFYDNILYRPGAVFTIHSMKEFTKKGMVLVDPSTQEVAIGPNDAIDDNRKRVHSGEESTAAKVDEDDTAGSGDNSVI